jgi:acetyl/propionyl-CoA carboxylase alpha subunit
MEFLVDASQNFYFLEMNTRLQVEHRLPEAVTGRDIVKEQIRIASGHKLSFLQKDIVFRGAASNAAFMRRIRKQVHALSRRDCRIARTGRAWNPR